MAPNRQLPKNPKAYEAMKQIVRGKKQSDIADRLRVSQSTVSNWKKKIEGAGARPKARARAVVPSTVQRNAGSMQVSSKIRTTVMEPGRITIRERINKSKASGSVTKQRTGPVKGTKSSIKNKRKK